MNSWCESCARKNMCYVVDDRPKCFVPITNTASGTPESYLAKSLRYSRDSHEIATTEPSNSEKPNNCEYAENPSGDVWECGCFLDTYCEHQIYDRNPDGTINIVECGYEPKDEPTISKMEQVDKDTNVRSKDEPQTERSE